MTMMKGLTARALTLACVVLSFTTAVAQIPRDYYASVNGKKNQSVFYGSFHFYLLCFNKLRE